MDPEPKLEMGVPIKDPDDSPGDNRLKGPFGNSETDCSSNGEDIWVEVLDEFEVIGIRVNGTIAKKFLVPDEGIDTWVEIGDNGVTGDNIGIDGELGISVRVYWGRFNKIIPLDGFGDESKGKSLEIGFMMKFSEST